MSELQNKAVALAEQSEGELRSSFARGTPFLQSALDLYFALGGDPERAEALAAAPRSSKPLRIDAAVANVMVELAVASHLNDIDMVQATYNRLDSELDP